MNDKFEYPNDYLSFIKDLVISSDSCYIKLFPLNELEGINKDYETDEYAPNFIAIGTNGSGVGIFINKENKQIYSIPFVGMEESDAVLLAYSFSEFIYKFENGELEIYYLMYKLVEPEVAGGLGKQTQMGNSFFPTTYKKSSL